MAFGDLLKKVASKGLELAGDAVEIGKKLVEEQKETTVKKAEEERMEQEQKEATVQKAEEERLEQERIEAAKREAAILRSKEAAERKQKQMEAILKPTCEKGDCLWYDNKFYFTCPEDCECERKKYTKKDWGSTCAIPEFWPYMKRIEKINKDYPGKFSRERDELMKKIYMDFMKEFFPQYNRGDWGLARVFVDRELGAQNSLYQVFLTIKNTPKPQEQIIQKLEFLKIYLTEELSKDPFCANISLYQRSMEDFEYTVKLFTTVLNKEKLREYFKDISEISVNELYDSEGRIKPVGFGGPQKGFYGDVLYNIVESWGGENGENDASYEEEVN